MTNGVSAIAGDAEAIMAVTTGPDGAPQVRVDTVITADQTVTGPTLIVLDGADLDNRGTIRVNHQGIGQGNGVLVRTGSTLTNEGLIESTASAPNGYFGIATGVLMEGLSDRFVNRGTVRAVTDAEGTAYGVQAGNVSNLGTIEAVGNYAYAYFLGAPTRNDGTLRATGLADADTQTGGMAIGAWLVGDFVNNGLIEATSEEANAYVVGIAFFTGSVNINVVNRIVNNGTISAELAIVRHASYSGALHLTNTGLLDGRIELDAGYNRFWNSADARVSGSITLGIWDDIVVNAGRLDGLVTLNGGFDLFDGRRSASVQQVEGGEGADVLWGGDAADVLNGGADIDLIAGGSGADVLTGGGGADLFVYRSASDSTAAAMDRIADFVSGEDRLDLSRIGATGITLTVDGAGTIVTAQTAAGALQVRVSGTIALTDIVTAPIGSIMIGTGGIDALNAGDGGVEMQGRSGDDVLIGGDGNDRIDGGSGADRMVGGLGDDIYLFDDLFDRVVEEADGGHDTVYSYADFHWMRDHVEDLYVVNGEYGWGNGSDNLIVGNARNNNLDGGGGVDRLVGGAGNDLYRVDDARDTVVEAAGEGRDRIVAADTGYYLPDHVEELELTAFRLAFEPTTTPGGYGVGNALDNLIIGSYLANLLLGGDGDDRIDAGEGADWMFGETGNDTLFGQNDNDVIDGGIGDDVIWGGNGADYLIGGEGDDALHGHREYILDVISGGPLRQTDFVTDILVGGAGNDLLDGASGLGDYDLMDGGTGNDVYRVDTPADLTFEAAGGGIDTVQADITGAGYYLYDHVENLVLEGATPFGVGNALANRITGSGSANWLLGGAGDDVLDGGGGNDVLFGEAGADRFVFARGTGGDVIGDFQSGTDRIDLSAFGFASFAAVQAAMGENGGTAFIDLGNGDFIVLNGVAMSTLGAGDFIL
ncbi:calcium-binding protein [Sphingomonas sp. CJ99]